MSTELLSHCLPETERRQDVGGYGLKPGKSASRLPLKRRGLRRTVSVKLKGEFVWHHHDTEDELFLVVKGSLLIKLHDGEIHLQEGEFVVIPRGVEHLPIAEEEAHVLLLEPKTTVNTGNVVSERTVTVEQRI